MPNQHIQINYKGPCDTEDYWKFSFAITVTNYIINIYNLKKVIKSFNISHCNFLIGANKTGPEHLKSSVQYIFVIYIIKLHNVFGGFTELKHNLFKFLLGESLCYCTSTRIIHFLY